ncbi:MAG TPA: heme-binding protein [Alphaproteobacteria bacterium]
MHTRVLASLAFAAAVLAGAAQAQQTPPAANPLDAIPDQMPFNVPYGAPITADRARAVISAAAEEAKKRGWPMNISVVDSGGNLVAFERMDGAQLASIAISEHKARTAAKFRRETKIFENGMQLSSFRYIATLDDVIASRGGIPLIEGGKLIGAVGCSGGTGSQDEAIAKVAAAVINK